MPWFWWFISRPTNRDERKMLTELPKGRACKIILDSGH